MYTHVCVKDYLLQRLQYFIFSLLCTLSLNSSSLIPTDSGSGYRQPKARLGRKHVRPWKWMPFTNSAREVYFILILSFLTLIISHLLPSTILCLSSFFTASFCPFLK